MALARRDSPSRGDRHLGFAKALAYEMPHTVAALECGALSEWRATLIVRESACLALEDRRALDAEPCGNVSETRRHGGCPVGGGGQEHRLPDGPAGVVDRAAKAAADRTVTIRPAPDTMTHVTVLLPAEFVTPTGAHYRSTAPPLPGPPAILVSEVEVRIGIAIAQSHAA